MMMDGASVAGLLEGAVHLPMLASSIAGRDLELTADTLRSSAPLVVLLMRRYAANRVGEPPEATRSVILDTVDRLARTAERLQAPDLEQGLDWWMMAYTGESFNGAFWTGTAMNTELRRVLQDTLNTSGSGSLLRRPVEQMHAARRSALKALGDRVIAADRDIFEQLLLEPIEAVIAQLERDPFASIDDIILEDAERMVTRADRNRTVPRNGIRWPQLVKTAEILRTRAVELQEISRKLASLAPIRTSDGSNEFPVSSTFEAVLLLDVRDTLLTDEQLGAALESATLAANAENRLSLANLLTRCGWSSDWVSGVQTELEQSVRRLALEIEDSTVGFADGQVEEYASEAIAAAEWGLTREADEWLGLLRESSQTARFRSNIESLMSRAGALKESPKVPLAELLRLEKLLSAALAQLDLGDMVVVTTLVESAEAGLNRLSGELGGRTVALVHREFLERTSDEAHDEPTRERPPTASARIDAMRSAVAAADEAEVIRQLSEARDDELPAMLRSVREGAAAQHRPLLWRLIAQALEQRPNAAQLLSGFRSPPIIRCEGKPPRPVDSGFLRVRMPHMKVTRSALERFPAIGAALESDDPSTAATLMRQVWRDGWAPALNIALANYVRAGKPHEAIELYAESRNLRRPEFVSQGVAWSLAVAYELVDEEAAVTETLDYVVSVSPGLFDAAQREQIHEFFDAIGKQRPTWPLTLDADGEARLWVQGRPTPLSYEQQETVKARQELENGDAKAAERRLRRLIDEVPRTPGTYLLLKIFREQGRYLDALQLMEQLEASQAASWWHYVQVARVALESEQGAAALSALGRAKALDPRACGNNADFLRLWDQANDVATVEARSVATLGGDQLSAEAIGRLARSGNLSREDWTRAIRRFLSEGAVAVVLDAAETASGSASWAVPAVVRALIDLGVAIDVEGREQLLRILRRNVDVAATLKLVERLNERDLEVAGSLDADGALEALLRGLLGTAPRRSRPWVAWHLADMLRAKGRDEAAQQVLNETFPRVRLPLGVATEPALPSPDPVEPTYSITGSMSEPLVAAIRARLEERPVEEQRDLWLNALASGDRLSLALPAALGAMVRCGDHQAAIDQYLRYAEHAFLNGATAWNVACALANLGDYEQASSWFAYAADLQTTDISDDRRQRRDAILARVGATIPQNEPDINVPDGGALTEAQFLQAAKQLGDSLRARLIGTEAAWAKLRQLNERTRPTELTSLQMVRSQLEMGHADEAFVLIASMMRSGVSDLQSGSRLLTLAACASSHVFDAATILERHSEFHYVCLDIARLCDQVDEHERAIEWAERAVEIKPTHLESVNYLAMLKSRGGVSDEHVKARAEATVVFSGLLADDSVEIILSIVAREAVQDAEVVTENLTFWIGDLAAGTSRAVRLESPPGARLASVTFASTYGNVVVRQTCDVPEPVVAAAVTLPFDPTQPANERLFVGRKSEIHSLMAHYESHTQVLFISGPRQVGKTSIVRRLRLAGREDRQLPLVAIMEGDNFRKDAPFLGQVTEFIAVELSKHGVTCEPAVDIDRVTQFQQWIFTSVRPLIGGRTLLVAIDEVQRILDACAEVDSKDTRDDVAGSIRTISSDADAAVRFLLLGSCTYASVRDRLERTTLAAEIKETQVGFLDRFDTRELVTRGFENANPSAVYLAESAHEAFWELTAGYPNHVHLLGQVVEQLLNSRGQRQANREIVESAAERLVQNGSKAVDHFLGREVRSTSQEYVLVRLAAYFGNREGVDAAPSLFELIREIGVEHQDGVSRLVRLGLLREESDGSVHVANGLVKNWLVRNEYELSINRQSTATHSDYEELTSNGFDIEGEKRDEIGRRVVLRTRGAVYVARQLRVAGVVPRSLKADGSQGLDSAGLVAGDPYGRWLVLTYAEGISLYDLGRQDSESWERLDTRKVVQIVHDTVATLTITRDECRCTQGKWAHGNLTPSGIISRGQRGVFVADLAFGADDQLTELTQLSRCIYRPPEQIERWEQQDGFRETDDVFALGVILAEALRADRHLPYPETSQGVSDTSQPCDLAVGRPGSWKPGVDDNLVRVIKLMCEADPGRRARLDSVNGSLSNWLRDQR